MKVKRLSSTGVEKGPNCFIGELTGETKVRMRSGVL